MTLFFLSLFLSTTSSTKRKIINAAVLEGLCTVQIATRLCCHLKLLANSRVTRELCTDSVPAAALLVVARIQCLASYHRIDLLRIYYTLRLDWLSQFIQMQPLPLTCLLTDSFRLID